MLFKGKKGPRGKKVFCKITMADLCRLKGISADSVRLDIRKGSLKPESIEDIIRWVNEPRTRSNKGKPLAWLDKPKP